MTLTILCIISAAIAGLLTGWAIRDSRDKTIIYYHHPVHGAHMYYKNDNRYQIHDN